MSTVFLDSPVACTVCKAPTVEFYSGGHRRCKPCFRKRVADRKAANPRKVRNEHLKSVYSITLERYEEMLAAQGGGCAICGKTSSGTRALAIDHDHSCCPGKGSCGACIRGLLCTGCNTGIGGLGDDPEQLEAAASYLRRFR